MADSTMYSIVNIILTLSSAEKPLLPVPNLHTASAIEFPMVKNRIISSQYLLIAVAEERKLRPVNEPDASSPQTAFWRKHVARGSYILRRFYYKNQIKPCSCCHDKWRCDLLRYLQKEVKQRSLAMEISLKRDYSESLLAWNFLFLISLADISFHIWVLLLISTCKLSELFVYNTKDRMRYISELDNIN